MNIDERYMRIAINLAKKAEGMTSPNPLVGAVIVKNGKIVGSGYHKRAGLPHAEINALRHAGPAAKDATLYVTLEPCDHFGRTPPCTDAIIKSRIKKVVAAMIDPNPVNQGRGLSRLKKSGIVTAVGVLEEEARAINKPYIKFVTTRLPYVTIKIAQSLDGKIATKTGDSKWITQEDSRSHVHELRTKVDAVMVGVNTIIRDNPLLISKVSKKRQPVRIVIDTDLKTPLSSRVFSRIDDSPVIIAAAKRSPRIKDYEGKGAEVLVAKRKNGKVDLKSLLKILGRRSIMHLLVEGGGELAAGFLEEGLADKLLFFIAPKIIGGKSAKTSVEGNGVAKVEDAILLKGMNIRRFKKDILIEADVT